MKTFEFDHHSEGFQDSRWETYREMRDKCPVAHSSTYDDGFWTVARYDDVFEVFRDNSTFSSNQQVIIPKVPGYPKLVPMESDSPDLERYRGALYPHYSPKAVKALEPIIEAYVKELLTAILPTGECEMVEAFCEPLPCRVTLAMLGLDIDYHLLAEPLHAVSYAEPGTEEHAKGALGVAEAYKSIEAEIDARIENPGDDMISQLLTYKDDEGWSPSRDEVLSMTRMTLSGGFDTVFAALSSILVLLDERRDLRAQLIDEPELIPTAIEEFLRFNSPVQGLARTVTKACTVGDQPLEPGQVVFALGASANRDERVFENPDELVLDRTPNRHMSFGIGPHRCLGAAIARAELRIALSAILTNMPDYEVVKEGVEYPRSIGIIAGVTRVPIRFTPRDHMVG